MAEVATYRPHLDGLRSFAVYGVVLFHAGLGRFTGGFIGVDLFFVLSGYLVTQTLLRDIDGHGGVRFGRFYSRRFRRLLPASAFALLVTAVLYRSVAAPGQAADALGSFQAAFLYVANWHFIRAASGYFGAAVEGNPLLHFWSLAVEEQFYAVWPLVLAGLFALGRRLRAGAPVVVVRAVIAAAGVGSLAWAFALQGEHPDRAYFGTDTRAYQLLAGALLALTPGIVRRIAEVGSRIRWAGLVAMVGLAVLTTSAVAVGPIARGALATALALVLIASLDAVPSGPLHRLLASEPLVYLGRISYGTYLWHWPVIVLLVTVADPSPLLLAGLAVLLASGLAALSAQLLELPVRGSKLLDGHRYAVIAGGLAISLVGGVLVAPAILERSPSADTAGPTASPTAAASGFTKVTADLRLEQVAADRFGSTVTCVGAAPSACTVVRGSGRHLLLMGDSNAQMLVPAFTAMAKANDLTLSLEVTGGCPWQRGFYAMSAEIKGRCVRHKEDAYRRVIPALDPDVIVLVNVARSTKTASTAETERATRRSLRELAAPGRTLVLVEPVVESPIEDPPLRCLQQATFVEDCRYVADTTPSAVDRMYGRMARSRTGVEVVDLDQLVCPYLPICDPVVAGRVVRWDYQHLATAYSASLGDELTEVFRGKGLLG